MCKLDLREKGAQILRCHAIVGSIDPKRVERARNNGSTRTAGKRELLAVMEEEARRLGRLPAFVSRY